MDRRHFLFGLASLTFSAALSAAETLPGKIYMTEYRDQFRSIVVLDPNTGKSRRLMKADREETMPRISPDGKTLLFACFDEEADWHIRKLDLASGKESQLVESDSSPVCWVDEHRFVACLDSQYWLCQADGVRIRKLADAGGSMLEGTMAPNGDFFYTVYGEKPQLMAMNLESGVARKLGPGTAPICVDGVVIYQSLSGIRQVRVSGGPATLIPALKKAHEKAFSPDGRFLAWTTDSDKGSKLVLGTSDYRVIRSFSITTSGGICWGL